MVKVLLIVLFIIAVYVFYKIYQKYKISHHFLRDRVRKKTTKKMAISFAQLEQEAGGREVDIDEQCLFDDVAKLFMTEKVQIIEKSQASKIQENVLKKMPLSTKALIQNHDVDDWSIFWTLQNQSLEYFVSRYGVFITHVDRDGIENKESILNDQNQIRFGKRTQRSSYFEL